MKRKYISNMPIEGFSKYHICKNGRLYSIHSGTWRLIKPVAKSTGYISNNLISDSGKRVNFYRHRLGGRSLFTQTSRFRFSSMS